ncbi:MAG: hypothetical protein JXM73_17760 [Anaerolineae bacterium]|nr:hypothetical protein [Anaerolineae bacterium]
MTEQSRRTSSAQPEIYEIKVEGHLDHHWSEWFDGLTVTHNENGDSILSGSIPDQAALHGLLGKVRDLGLVLISVRRREPQHQTQTSYSAQHCADR